MIHVKLTVKDLYKTDPKPCGEGIELFKKILPGGIDTEWTWLHSLLAAKLFGKYYTWAWVQRLVPGPNFRRVNLRGLDLSGIDFLEADFSWARLDGCNLNDANLSYCNLYRADLDSAQLKNTIFDYADVSFAYFDNALIDNASFKDVVYRYTVWGKSKKV